jgi:hypothetical protein
MSILDGYALGVGVSFMVIDREPGKDRLRAILCVLWPLMMLLTVAVGLKRAIWPTNSCRRTRRRGTARPLGIMRC